MKKTLVALAALAAVSAFAQSTVGIKGTFDPSLANQTTTFGDGTVRTTNGLLNSQSGTSQVTFFGTEDIGGGLKANFLLENDFNSTNDAKGNWGSSTNSSSTGNVSSLGGETYVGLTGSYGDIKIGAPNSPSLDVTGRTSFGTKVGSGFSSSAGTGVQGLGHVRENNQVVYTSPEFKGFTLKAAVAGKAAATVAVNSNAAVVASSQTKEDIGVTYVNGPLKAVLVNYRQENTYKQTHGYVAYTMGALTATYGFNRDERLTSVTGVAGTDAAAGKYGLAAGKVNGQNVNVAYAMGATTLMANVGRSNDTTSSNKDMKISAIGAKYDLSKRTNIYARYVKLTTDNLVAATLGDGLGVANQKTTLVGLQHNF